LESSTRTEGVGLTDTTRLSTNQHLEIRFVRVQRNIWERKGSFRSSSSLVQRFDLSCLAEISACTILTAWTMLTDSDSASFVTCTERLEACRHGLSTTLRLRAPYPPRRTSHHPSHLALPHPGRDVQWRTQTTTYTQLGALPRECASNG